MATEILIIEDSSDARELYRRVLEMEKLTLDTVSDAEEALDYLESHTLPQLILLDLTMPGMGGEKFVKLVKEREEWSKIKILIVSGWDSLKEKAEALNADGYIQKPVEFDSLIAEVRKCL